MQTFLSAGHELDAATQEQTTYTERQDVAGMAPCQKRPIVVHAKQIDAPFRVQSMEGDHIVTWSNPGDLVLDPFSGSGTTAKAAKELGRRFLGLEINPEYCAIAERRIAQQVLELEEI